MRFLSNSALLFGKIGLTAAFAGLVLSRVNLQEFANIFLHPAPLLGFACAVLCLCLQSCLAAVRQVHLVSVVNYRLSRARSLRIWFSGLLVSQVFITFIAGDVARALQLAQAGVPRLLAGQVIVLDRAIGFVTLMVLVVATVPILFGLSSDATTVWAIAGLCGLGILAFIIGACLPDISRFLPDRVSSLRLVRVLGDCIASLRLARSSPIITARVFGLSVVMHLLNVFAMACIATSIGLQVDLGALMAIALPSLLLSLLPISLSGWGVREAAMITGFSLLGVSAANALAVSIGFGLSLIATSLLGLPALLVPKSSRKACGFEPTLASRRNLRSC